MSGFVTDAETLQDCVGKLPGPRDLKVIDFLDAHAIRWIAASPLLFAAFGDEHRLGATLGGGPAGFVRVDDARRLSLPSALLDDADAVRTGQAFASLLLVPGLGETLRVNGRVTDNAEDRVSVAVDECYLHCAKALLRSGFWQAAPMQAPARDDPMACLAQCRFMVLATHDAQGHADVSPKGDPAGALLRMHDDALWFADRPGNRRVDSFRNLLARPQAVLLALVPGGEQVLRISGTARISADEAACRPFAVDGKTPKLATRIDPPCMDLRHSAALQRARPWLGTAAPDDIEPAAIFRDHVKHSRERGLQAALVRAGISLPGVMRKGLDHDYRHNLY